MNRLTFAALVAAFALVTSSGVAAAAGDDARSSATKPANGKGKSCKAKGKARGSDCKRSCKQKGKKKTKKNCESKGKGRKAAGGWPLDGYYEGRGGIALSVAARGRKTELVYSPTNAKTCIEYAGIGLPATAATSSSTLFSADGEGSLPNGQYSWSIAVNRDLTYRVTISSSSVNPYYGPCDRPGAVFTGRLKRVR